MLIGMMSGVRGGSRPMGRGVIGSATGAVVGVGLLAVGALVGLGVAGCGVLGSDSTEVRSYQVTDSVQRLDLRNEDGKVEVRAGDGPVRVTETLTFRGSEPSTSHAVQDGTLNLRNQHCQHCSVSYLVQLPAGTAVNVQTSAGKVILAGLAGDVTVDASAGAVDGTGLRSPHTSVHGRAGKITLAYDAAPSTVDARTSAGEVDISVPGDGGPYAVDASTSAGSTQIAVPTDPGASRKITAHTTAGKIVISPTGPAG
jgi:DUF4097 and DUF4098 domain-containing protein YvlB